MTSFRRPNHATPLLAALLALLAAGCSRPDRRHYISAYEHAHGTLPPSGQAREAAPHPTSTEPKQPETTCFFLEELPEREIVTRERVLVQPAQVTTNLYAGVPEWEETRVLVREAGSSLKIIPAQFDWIEDPNAENGKRKVVISPARTEPVEIPAVYETNRVARAPKPGEFHVRNIPAEYRIVETRRVIPATTQRIEILCEQDQSPGIILKLQQALKQRGYNPGAFDGVMGPKTLAALEAFAEDYGLPDVPWSMDALHALGVDRPRRSPN